MIFEKTDNTYIQLFRYFFVAAGAFVMDYGFYFLLSYIFGVQYLIAAIAGFIAGTSTNYLISKYMGFQPRLPYLFHHKDHRNTDHADNVQDEWY